MPLARGTWRVRASGAAPLRKSTSTASLRPYLAASSSGVSPESNDGASKSAFLSQRSSSTWGCPFTAARTQACEQPNRSVRDLDQHRLVTRTQPPPPAREHPSSTHTLGIGHHGGPEAAHPSLTAAILVIPPILIPLLLIARTVSMHVLLGCVLCVLMADGHGGCSAAIASALFSKYIF